MKARAESENEKAKLARAFMYCGDGITNGFEL